MNEYESLLVRKGGDYSGWHKKMYDIPSAILSDSHPLRILDVGCGIGYGFKSMCSHNIKGVYFGIDTDEQSIGFCNKTYHNDNLTPSFLCEDFMGFSTSDDFDVVFCIEVIEHINQQDRQFFIQKVMSLSHNLIFLSTPDRKMSEHGIYTPNEMVCFLKPVVNVVIFRYEMGVLYVIQK